VARGREAAASAHRCLLAAPELQVTDCRALTPEQMEGRWLYGGGAAAEVAPGHVAALLAAAMAPEELRDKDPPAAARMRAAQAALLRGLVGGRQAEGVEGGSAAPAGGVLYSVPMRWGLLFEVRRSAGHNPGSVGAPQQGAAARPLPTHVASDPLPTPKPQPPIQPYAQEEELGGIEAAADAGDVARLHALLLGPRPPRSQQLYARSLAASGGWQLHPASAAVWGWLNLANSAFCGSGSELIALAGPAGGSGPTAATGDGAAAAGAAGAPGEQQQEASAAGPSSNGLAASSGSASPVAAPVVAAAAGAGADAGPGTQSDAPGANGAVAAVAPGATDAPGGAPTWVGLALGVLRKVSEALAPVAAVLLRYAGKADRQRDEALLKDMREVGCRRWGAGRGRSGRGRAARRWGARRVSPSLPTPAGPITPASRSCPAPQLLENLADAFQGTRALLDHAAARGAQAPPDAGRGALAGALAAVVLVMDALAAYTGDDGALEEATVDHFLSAAAALDAAGRAEALAAAAPWLRSGRWASVAAGGGGAWVALAPELKAALQLPGSRVKRQRVR
jgi:hypothetical protein